MNYNSVWLIAILILVGLVLTSCATPTSPTGGPADEQGPEIIRTQPKTGTTNFSGQSVTLHFSEFVERSSLNQAIVLEPDIGISYSIDWGRKSAEVAFDRQIPDSTTLILTVGTDLKDTNNNGMSSPKKIAVSTGSEIDEGEIIGKVIDAATGEGSEGKRVLLYREPYDLTKKADYIASTDTSGQFQFSYLPQGKFKLFWVDDRNRNKVWDPQQERAQPFKKEFVTLKKGGKDTLGTLFSTSVDTTQPTLQGVGLFSSNRLRMRFSEDIVLSDSANIVITDTLGNEYSTAWPLYIPPNEPYILFAHSRDSLAPETSYNLSTTGIFDGSENPVADYTDSFTGSAQEDTTQQRIIKRNTVSGYYPDEPFEITYAKPIDDPAITDSLKIVEADSLIDSWPNVDTEQNILRIRPNEQWKDGVSYEVRVWDPKVEDYRKFDPKIWHSSQMGSLNIMMEDSTLNNLRLRIENKESGFERDTLFTDQIEIDNLPPLSYKLTVYHDENNNGRWDYGQIDPYIKPEPYYIRKQVPVEKGLTGDLTIEFPN
ncbi:Ig-like domain-containing protein [Fodinibius sp.]|uniref:Ig-like domain-containing protein n=1 Tax=Fodinibius sp. TaxID=1872440 RepID=UPI002ACD4625|nr:Ig-like domain-containing protein [Fodinibius sp.]MDZ7659158.1 Ig-like domain-containing protein [Fodinibius sp.]